MKRQALAGEIDLLYLDESGFAPTFPISYTWAREGVRPTVSYEAPQGRRVNVLGALAPYRSEEPLICQSFTHTIKAPQFVEFVWHHVGGLTTPLGVLPEDYQRVRPCVIVLDNYSVHKNKAVTALTDSFAAAGLSFFFLPPYSPDLNLIEPIWRHVKHEDIPVRSHATVDDLKSAVDGALATRKQRLARSTLPSLGHPLDSALSTNSLPKPA